MTDGAGRRFCGLRLRFFIPLFYASGNNRGGGGVFFLYDTQNLYRDYACGSRFAGGFGIRL